MAICRACGGVLGRDCFNEADCMSISHADEQEIRFKANCFDKQQEDFQAALVHLKTLIDVVEELQPVTSGYTALADAYAFHQKHTIQATPAPAVNYSDEDSDLPF